MYRSRACAFLSALAIPFCFGVSRGCYPSAMPKGCVRKAKVNFAAPIYFNKKYDTASAAVVLRSWCGMAESAFGRAFCALLLCIVVGRNAHHDTQKKCADMAFQKVDKKFVLSDSSLNVYGMKLLTSGYQMDEFTKNPIGYYGHDPKDGVLLRWDDVQLDGDSVVGYPAINLDHPRGQRTYNEIMDGFLNSASVGKLCILEYHLEDNADDPKNPVVVVTKWYNKECSVVDNPGNRNAMKVELFDMHDNEINLSDITDKYFQTKQPNMKEVIIQLTPEVMGLLGLKDEQGTADAVVAGIKHLHAENIRLSDEAKTAAKNAADEKVKQILDKGLADGKFTKATRDKLEAQFAGKPTELADVVDSMETYVSIAERLKENKTVLKDKAGKEINLADCTYEEVDRANLLEVVKAEHPAVFDRLMKEIKK